MRRTSFLSSASLFALTAFWLVGCAVGPDFEPPAAPDVSAYDAAPPPDTTADGAQKLQAGQDIPAQWWALFHSESLNKLVTQAIKDNPDLASAEAALRVAEDNLSAGGGVLWPSVNGAFSTTRAKSSAASSGNTSAYTLYNASVGVSYTLDLWGGARRGIEQLQAQAEAARFQREAAYLALTSNVVTAAVQDASLREQVSATRAIVADQEKVLKVLKARFDVGAVAKSAVLEQQAALAATKATLPALEHQQVVMRHALLALMGRLPTAPLDAAFSFAELSLPAQVPLSLPSKLVEQRPDIRAAQENLHAASAAIGVAEAARLPNIVLSADIGSMARVFADLFSPGRGFWDMGASASQVLFDAGTLADKEQATRDAFDAAAAQYRKAVLAGFQDVADALHALQSDAESLTAKTEAEQAAAASLALARAQFEAGAVSSVELLLAQQTAQQAKVALVQGKAQRYADTAALFAALGGGWWNREQDNAANAAASDKGAL